MLLKTSELTGPALDWAVASILGSKFDPQRNRITYPLDLTQWVTPNCWFPSSNWAQGGPIIDLADIEFISMRNPDYHQARTTADGSGKWVAGPTKLIAAMRCFVASKLGDEVDVPEELL